MRIRTPRLSHNKYDDVFHKDNISKTNPKMKTRSSVFFISSVCETHDDKTVYLKEVLTSLLSHELKLHLLLHKTLVSSFVNTFIVFPYKPTRWSCHIFQPLLRWDENRTPTQKNKPVNSFIVFLLMFISNISSYKLPEIPLLSSKTFMFCSVKRHFFLVHSYNSSG